MNDTMTTTATAACEKESSKFQVRLSPAPPDHGAAQSGSSALEFPGAASGPGNEPQHLLPRPSSPDAAARFAGRRLATWLGAAALGTLAIYAGCRWWQHARAWVRTDNAYLAAHIHQVSSRVAGNVQEVLVQENDFVNAGAVLARLDARDFEVRRQQAQAQAAQARAQLGQAQAQVSLARAHIAREQATLTKTQQDLERARTLSQGSAGAISKQEFDAAQAAAQAAQAGRQAAEAALESARSLAAAAKAGELAADANLKEAELQLGYTEIVAPAAGRIGCKNLERGNRVQPGQPLLALVQPAVWVVANFKETQLTRLRPGQPARLRLDSFPGRVFPGRIESLAPASGAQFALLPPDNATGNFTRIVQRVPVKIVFDSPALDDCQGRVMPGMSAIVEVKVRE